MPLSGAQCVLKEYPVTYYRGNPPVYRFGSSHRGFDAVGRPITGDLIPIPLGEPPLNPRTDRPELPSLQPCVIHSLDTLNAQYIEMVKRAPVNINTAPLEVLVALLADIKGFFLTDRRRDNPYYDGDMYLSFKQKNSQSPAGTEGDEYGFLAVTVPIVMPGGTGTAGILATDIAKHIIACRNAKRVSAVFPGAQAPTVDFDYGAATYTDPTGNTQELWFKGQFKTWVQFYAFVDNLMVIGLIKDNRPYWFDYTTTGGADATGFGPLVESPVQRNYATRAIADAIKANFNPNLHLNETNPDDNLFLIVDKTDLFVNSTEFTFMPTGYFEIEALGRVLRPLQGDDARMAVNELVAQAKVVAAYQLFNVYRETNQKQFYAGEFAGRLGYETNNNRSVECGPEPDNGAAPSFNEYSGYLALPTIGGMGHDGVTKPRNVLWRTAMMQGSSHFGSAFHAHYQLDFDCHHHILGPEAAREIGSRNMAPDEYVENFPDPYTNYPGPYDPTKGPGGNRHRLARSFRLKAGSTNPTLVPIAPSDLRIDGGYCERHCAASYLLHKGGMHVWNFDVDPARGMSSFWVKPSFDPERTGKIRTFWDVSKYHTPCNANVNVWPFAVWFFPAHREKYDTIPHPVPPPPRYWGNNLGYFHPMSMTFGHKAWHNVPYNSEFGRLTCSLNHYHYDPLNPTLVMKSCPLPSPFRGRRWLNLTLWWYLDGQTDSVGDRVCTLLVNGIDGPRGGNTYATYTYNQMTGYNSGKDKMHYMNNHDDNGGPIHLRIGSASKIGKFREMPYRGNHSADFTIDELYVWAREDVASKTVLWDRGRYYMPEDASEGKFTSQIIMFTTNPVRVLPKQSAATPPGGTDAPPPPSNVTPTYKLEPLVIRILGVSWTWYGEPVLRPEAGNEHFRKYRRVLYNWNNRAQLNGLPAEDLMPEVHLSIQDGNTIYGPYEDDSFSPVRAADGTPPIMQNPNQIRYIVQFRLIRSNPGAILLATPVLDDVTIYWDEARMRLLSYLYDNRAF